MSITIYHNPRCSKSRETLAIIQDNGVTPTVVEYLKTPLSAEALSQLLSKLNMKPSELVRKKEKLYSELNLKIADEKTLLTTMAANPTLIERPIVTTDTKAIIGRPPENVLTLLPNN